MEKKILVVVAHPDDEVLGCGGTIAKYNKLGNEISLLILGEGITSRDKVRNPQKRVTELNSLKIYTKEASKILGIKKVFTFNFPDNRFDTVAVLDIVKAIEEVTNKVNPEVIYTHHQGDLNIDHQITFKAVLTACRPIYGETVKEIYSFEIPSSTEWSASDDSHFFNPNVFIDISNTFNKKIEAMKAYKSELREYPHPRSTKALEIIARRWGIVVGKKLVEAFLLIRSIKE
ncbi:MAG: PIG-L family deacetylase [bacterium]|nr:PIG-L family deacetylase [bacterium]